MIFVDEAKIYVQAGDGGKGCESFYKDNYIRFPRPDGGDGGRGGDIIFQASRSRHTLLDFRLNQHYKGGRGGHASSKRKRGKSGKVALLKVPMGTVIRDFTTGLVIRDLVEDGQSVIVAKGGRPGIGNANRKNVRPPGIGEELTVGLELKVMADVGLLGFPNAGKSTLISSISRVKSKVANYPFTTKQPILGLVSVEESQFVIADLPGIIEGAHKGRGLGDRFLRHAERTSILVHMIDMAGTEGRDPLDDYMKMVHELSEYGDSLASKISIVVANKMDMPEAQDHLKRFKQKFSGPIFEISSLNRIGLNPLIYAIKEQLCIANSPDQSSESL